MKLALRIVAIVLFAVMVASLIDFATKLNFGSPNDKEPIIWIFFLVILIYVLVSFFFMWKAYKTQQAKYRNVLTILGVIYLAFLLYLYLSE